MNATRHCLGDVYYSFKEYLKDKKLGIETDCDNIPIAQGLKKDGTGYEPTRYSTIQSLIDYLQPHNKDVLVEYGCGKGRVVCMFSRNDTGSSIGIEFDERLASIARSNIDRLKGRISTARILAIDAIEFDPRDGTIFFIANSFGIETLELVLKQIHKSIIEFPRNIRIVYLNPCHKSLLDKPNWLAKETDFRDLWPPVSIWRNKTKTK